MTTQTIDTAAGLLEPALLRCLLAIDEFHQPLPPLDPEDCDAIYPMRLTVTKHFTPEALEDLARDEGRLLALTNWALYSLMSKPFIVRYHSTNVRWRWVSPPRVMVDSSRPERIGLTWLWDVQFCAPRDTTNVYLQALQNEGPQLELFGE